MEKIQGRHMPLRRSLWIVGIYLLVGWLWITFSDYLVQQLSLIHISEPTRPY